MVCLLTCRATYCEFLGCMLISQTNSRGCNACINHARAPEKCASPPVSLCKRMLTGVSRHTLPRAALLLHLESVFLTSGNFAGGFGAAN